jgi:hypothetical protein
MDEDNCSFDGSIPPFDEAKALCQSIVTIRTAQGKNMPSDFPHGSSEWQATALEFVQDIDRLLAR